MVVKLHGFRKGVDLEGEHLRLSSGITSAYLPSKKILDCSEKEGWRSERIRLKKFKIAEMNRQNAFGRRVGVNPSGNTVINRKV